jgi:ATP-dependent Clp protease ATP-binding subunit ClpX
VRILTEPKNALVRQYQQLFRYDNVELEFTEDALVAIAKKALARGTGARGLRSVMEALLQKTMFDLPSCRDVEKCIIDEAAVNIGADIALVYRDVRDHEPEMQQDRYGTG